MRTREIAQIESEIRHFRIEQKELQAVEAAQKTKPERQPIPKYVVYLLATLICVLAYNL